MKWTFLNRRSGGQKLATRDSPLNGVRFDPSNSDAMCDDNAEATQIAYKQLFGQMEPMNVVDDEEAHDTSSRDRTDPAFKSPDDTAHPLLASFSEADAGVQSSSPLRTSAHFETVPPEDPNNAILLQAANALERVEAYIEQCTASLRYFVDLGNGSRSRDFADVKRNLTNTHALMNSSAPILLIVRELAVGFRALATKEATRRAGIILKPDDQPPVTGSTTNERDEPKRVDRVLSVPLEESSPSPASQPVDPVPTQEQQDEPQRVDPGSTPNERVEPKRVDRVLSVPLEEPSPSPASQPVKRVLTPNEQDEPKRVDPGSTPAERDGPKRVDMVLSEIEFPLEEPSPSASQPVDPVPTQRQQDEPKRVDPGSTPKERDEPKRVDMVLSEIEISVEEPRPTPASQPVDPVQTPNEQDEPKRIDPGSTSNEWDEPRRVDMVLSEIEVPLEEPSADSQPTLQVDPVLPTQKQQDEQKRVDPGSIPNEQNEPKQVDMVLSEIEVPLEEPSTDGQPTLQVDPVPTEKQQDEQKRIDMVLSEIQIILTERPPIQKVGIEQGDAALPVSENDGLDASLKVKGEIPLNAHHVQCKQNELKMSDPVTQEIEALLGVSLPTAEDFFPKHKR